jgi:two-component system, LuxR family, response regulator DctR
MSIPTVLLVDDDAEARAALAFLFRTRQIHTREFDSGTALVNWASKLVEAERAFVCCTVLDVRMPGLSGLQVFDFLQQEKLVDAWPVIFLTGHGDVPMAVEALKNGAFDFFEKPLTDNKLVDRVIAALNTSAARLEQTRSVAQIHLLVASLTERERTVMDMICAGRLNKVIADDLGISMRTVEVHRARIFNKMGVRSAVELSNLLRKN